jgi:hypothetical protein
MLPGATHLVLLLILCVGFSIYGSLVPFHFVSKSLLQAFTDFLQIKLFSLHHISRSDGTANFRLYLPIGFLGTGIYQLDRGGPGRY